MDPQDPDDSRDNNTADIESKARKNFNDQSYEEVELHTEVNDESDYIQPAEKLTWLKKYEWIIKILAPIALLIGFNIFYVNSLAGCPYDIGENPVMCIDFFKTTLSKWVLELMASSLCILMIVFLAWRKYIPRIWLLIALIDYIVIFLLQNGNSMENHGGLNRVVLTLWCLLFILITLLMLCFIKFYRSLRNKIFFPVPFLIILFLVFLFYRIKIKNSCVGWEYGLGGAKLENDGKHCTVPIPTYCEFVTRNHIFDINKLTKECSKKSMVFNPIMLPLDMQAKQNFTYLGFPRTEDYSNELKADKAKYKEFVRSSMIDFNDESIPQEVKDNVEFKLDLTNLNETKLHVEVKPNITRAEELKKVRKEVIDFEKAAGTYSNRVDKNVLILYFDNLSRAHFYRKMPKTAEWLSQFTKEDEDLAAFQYFRYHSVYYNTLWSNNAMYYGEIQNLKSTSKNVFDSFSENGYVTGFFKDACEMTSNAFEPGQVDDVQIHRWDHFASSFTCDINFDSEEAVTSLDAFHGRNSVLRRCLYGQNLHHYQLEYVKQFWEAYPENRKFMRTHFSEAHEMLGELVLYIDDDVHNFLDNFYKQGYLDDTMLIVLSDHGAHSVTIRVPIFPDNSRFVENYLPILIHLAPKDIPVKSLDFLRTNEQSLISSHDVYATLGTIATNKKFNEYSYISEQLPEDRDCTNSPIFLGDCWCQNDVDQLEEQMGTKSMFSFSF